MPEHKQFIKKANPLKPYLTLSALAHVILFALLFTTLFFSGKPPVIKQGDSDKQVIQAVAVSQGALKKEIEKVQRERARREELQQEKLKAYQQQVAEAKKQREQEAVQVKKLKEAQLQLEKAAQLKQQEAKERLAALQREQALQTQRLKAVQIEKAKEEAKQKLEEQLAKKLKAKEALKKKLAEAQKSAQDDLLKQELNADQSQLNAAQNQFTQGEVNKYKALILNAIQRNWVVPNNLNKDLSTELLITLAPGGAVLNVKIAKSSGDVLLDRSAMAAVYKASPLPVPDDNRLFQNFRTLDLLVKPLKIIS